MADEKTTQLAATTTMALTDIMPVVTGIGGLPITKKITLGDFIKSTGWTYLTTPLTVATWAYAPFSTTAKTKIDLSAVFGVPAGVTAILAAVTIRDSGSAAGAAYFVLGPDNVADNGQITWCSGIANDAFTSGASIVTCDAAGDVYYQVLATGAGTLDVFIQIWGYCYGNVLASSLPASEAKKYGGFFAYSKAILLNIIVANTYQSLYTVTAADLAAGVMTGFTFTPGRLVDANITSEANPSGTLLLITCSGNHGLTSGQLVVLGNCNNAGHNKPTRVTVTGLTTFTCNDIAYVAGAAASSAFVEEPAQLIAGTGSAGVYFAGFVIDGTAANANKDWKFELNVNLTAQDNIVTERLSTNTLASMSSFGHITIADGDRVWFSGKNVTDATDYTIRNFNLNLHKI